MKSITLSFQVHQPIRFKPYRFTDIGNDSRYYDEQENERLTKEAAKNLYLPTNEKLIDLMSKYEGGFRVAFSISGTTLDQFCMYAPEVIESFQRMAQTGGVEFLSETYSFVLGFSIVSIAFIVKPPGRPCRGYN
jgi:alpha-amylase